MRRDGDIGSRRGGYKAIGGWYGIYLLCWEQVKGMVFGVCKGGVCGEYGIGTLAGYGVEGRG